VIAKEIQIMNISLTPQLEKYLQQKVATGSYNNASEVVREALRLMEERDQERAARLAGLRQEIQEGVDSGSVGKLDIEAIKRQARAEWEAEQTAKQAR
jgi:antitoxin ParD1/3/4